MAKNLKELIVMWVNIIFVPKDVLISGIKKIVKARTQTDGKVVFIIKMDTFLSKRKMADIEENTES